MHCFGHIHSGWGAKSVAWRPITEQPSHFTDIDNENSEVIEDLASITKKRFDDEAEGERKAQKLAVFLTQGYCATSATDGRTLFVNAATKGSESLPWQPAWVVDMDLPTTVDR